MKNGEEEVKRIKKLALLPAEMEKVILPKEVLTTIQNELVIEIEEGQ